MTLRTLTPIDNAAWALHATIQELRLELAALDPDGNITTGLEKLQTGISMIRARGVISATIKRLEADLREVMKLIPPPDKTGRRDLVLIDPFKDKPFKLKNTRRKS